MTTANGPLLEIDDLFVRYRVPRGFVGGLRRKPRLAVHAVDGVTLTVQTGELVALVGESGCGKTTTAQAVLRLVDPASGSIRFRGDDITELGMRALRPVRRRMQIVYQDPYESLDPRLRVRATVEEPLLIHGIGSKQERPSLVCAALTRAGLSPPELYLERFHISSRAASGSASLSPPRSCSIHSSLSPTSPCRCSTSPSGRGCSVYSRS